MSSSRPRGDDRALIQALQSRPGRGGVRLSYGQAERLLEWGRLLRELLVERTHLRDTIRRQREQQQALERRLDDLLARLAEHELELQRTARRSS